MKLFTGDETGLVKIVSVETEKTELLDLEAVQSRNYCIDRICSNESSGIIVAQRNGIVQCYEDDGMKKWQVDTKGRTVGLGMKGLKKSNLVVCNEKGDVGVYDIEKSIPSVEFSLGVCPETMKLGNEGFMGIGGKDVNMQIWNLETQSCIFKSKNVQPDNLDMQVPIWVKDFDFMQSSNDQYHKMVVGTAYHHVRIYDTRAQRRPSNAIEFGDHAINVVKLNHDETQVLIGDVVGNVSSIDLRTMQRLKRYVGPCGSIRDISFHPNGKHFAVVGLDRMAFIYELHHKLAKKTIYLKQRLTSVLFHHQEECQSTTFSMESTAQGDHHDQDDDDDDEMQESDYEGLECSSNQGTDDEDSFTEE